MSILSPARQFYAIPTRHVRCDLHLAHQHISGLIRHKKALPVGLRLQRVGAKIRSRMWTVIEDALNHPSRVEETE